MSDELWKLSEPFAPRPIHFREIYEHNGWRFKVYDITCGDKPLAWEQYQHAIARASKDLPEQPQTKQRPGVGFIICHQGHSWHYLVVCWWDSENELVTRIFVQKSDEKDSWRKAGENQSICVWDIEILWFERNAYIETVLSNPDAPDLGAYLDRHISIDV